MVQVKAVAGLRSSSAQLSSTLWLGDSDHRIDLGPLGVVIGYVFARSTGLRIRHLPQDLAHQDVTGLATWLVRECWGTYVALFNDLDAIQVLPDPSGLLPVYVTTGEQDVVCSSDPGLIGQSGCRQLEVSWEDLFHHLQHPSLRSARTCLSGLCELAPGYLVRLGDPRTAARPIWVPASFMPDGGTFSFEALSVQLREIATHVLGAWSALSSRVVVAASGGVDSSLIAAALADARRDFALMTVATSDPSGDERAHVRVLAQHLGVPLFEGQYAPQNINLGLAVSARGPRPGGKAFMHETRRVGFEARRALGGDIVFDGNGGDNLFCYLHSAAPVLDRWFCDGLSRGTWSTLVDMCRVTETTVPQMARAFGRRWARGTAFAPQPADSRLLSGQQGQSAIPETLRDWRDQVPRKHPGKVDHLALLLATQNHLHGAGPSPAFAQFSPLMSQPLLEFCLSVPTWIWCMGGINRALARAAFADVLPAAVTRRISKAGPDSLMHMVFAANHALIRDMLMDGLLMRNGILDRHAVDLALSPGKAGVETDDATLYRLLDLTEAEAWVRSWR